MKKIQLKTSKPSLISCKKGFTMIELMAVLVILGVMVSVIIKKFNLLTDTASITTLQSGVRELKSRESVTWFKIKLSETGYTTDSDVYNSVDKNIGPGYSWNPGPAIGGGRLYYKSQSVLLNRSPSTPNSPASWF